MSAFLSHELLVIRRREQRVQFARFFSVIFIIHEPCGSLFTFSGEVARLSFVSVTAPEAGEYSPIPLSPIQQNRMSCRR